MTTILDNTLKFCRTYNNNRVIRKLHVLLFMIISVLVVVSIYIYISGVIYCASDDGSLDADDNISVANTDTDNTNFSINLTDSLFNIFLYFIKPIRVEGHLDDLIGQQIIIHMSLFLLTISLILLFIFYIMNNIFLHYKTFFEKKFNNKIIKFYIKYQSF